MAGDAKKIIDLGDYISGEEALQIAARSLRSLKNDINNLSKTVADDSGRIAAGFATIKQGIADIQSKAGKLQLFSGEDKAILAALAQQLGELKKRQEDYKATQAAQITIQRGLTDSVKVYNSELAKQKQALVEAQKAGDVEAQKRAASAIRQTTQETKDFSAALRGANSGLTAAKGSYNELVIENNKLLASLHALDGGLAGNNVEAKKLQEQIFANTQVLKEFDAATNRNFREVGNYAKGFSGLVAELAKARAAQAGLAQGSEEYNRAQIKVAGFQTAAQRSAAQMGLSYEQAEARINDVAAAVQPLTTALVRLEQEQERVAVSAGKDSEAYQRIGFQIQQTKKEIDDVAASTAKVDVANEGLEQQLGFTREALEEYLTQLAVGAIGLQALAQAAVAVFQANVEYSRNLAEVRKTTGLTADEADRLGASLKALNTTTSLDGLLKIASVGGQLGIAKDDLVDFTKAIDTAVQALGNDFAGGAEEIATILGKISNVFGKELGGDVSQNILAIGSAVNELGAVGSATAPFLTDVAQRVGGIAVQSGLGLKDVLAYAAVLEETGSRAEVAGSSLGRLFSTLSTKTKEAFEIAQKANPALTLKEYTRLVNTDFNQAIQLFLKGLNAGNASTTEVAKRLGTLKLESGEARTAILTLAQNTELFAERQKTANQQLRDATSLAAEAAVINDTLAGTVDRNVNSLKNFFVSGTGANVLKFLVAVEAELFKLVAEPFRQIGDGLTYIGQKVGLVDKPLTDYTKSIVENTLAARKQTGAQQELLKSYIDLANTTGRTSAQELDLAKTRSVLLKQFGTDDAAAIQAAIDKRRQAAESNIQFFKNDIAQYDRLITEANLRAAAAQNTLNTAPRNNQGVLSTRAGQDAAQALLVAEKDLAEQQRLRGQAVAALAKLEGQNTQAKKDGAEAADEETAAELQLDRAQVQRAKNRVSALRDELADNEERLKSLRAYQAQQGKLFEDGQISPEVANKRLRGSEDLATQIQRDGAAIRIKIARAEAQEKLAEAENDRVRQLKKKDITQAEITDIEQQASLRRVEIRRQEGRQIEQANKDLRKAQAVEPLEFKVPTIDFDKLKADLQKFVVTYQYELEKIKNAEQAVSTDLVGQLARREISERDFAKKSSQNRLAAAAAALELDKKYHRDTLNSQKEFNEALLAEEDRKTAERIALIEKVGSFTQEAEAAFFAIKGNLIDADIQRTQEAYDNEIKAAGENTAAKEAIQKKYDKQLKKLNYDKAKNERDQAVISVAINTAVAVAKSIAEYGLPAGLIPAGIALALGALQEAVILSKPLPAYFKGRKSGPAELATVSERGPELIQEKKTGRFKYVAEQAIVRLGEGDKVFTAQETTAMLASAGLSHSQAQQQPGIVAQALSGAAHSAASAREAAAGQGYNKLAENLAANTAALKKIQAPKIIVHRGSDADVETARQLTHYVGTVRRFIK